MYAVTDEPNVKWGRHRFQMGETGTTAPTPLATALALPFLYQKKFFDFTAIVTKNLLSWQQ